MTHCHCSFLIAHCSIYLHSALVQTRPINRHSEGHKREALRYFSIETALTLGVSTSKGHSTCCRITAFHPCNRTHPSTASVVSCLFLAHMLQSVREQLLRKAVNHVCCAGHSVHQHVCGVRFRCWVLWAWHYRHWVGECRAVSRRYIWHCRGEQTEATSLQQGCHLL